MRITSIVEALVQCGATPEMILCAVRAAEAGQQSDIDRRRASDRERQQRHRAHVTSRAVTATGGAALSDKERSPTPPKEINSPDNTQPPSPSHRLSGGRRAVRLPEQFQPDRDFAARLGFGEAEVELELEKFRDYWTAKSGRDAAKLDWLATWRNWMRNAARPRKNHRPQASPGESAFARHQRECRQAIERELNGNLEHDDLINTQPTFDLEPGDYRAH
ncbi:hypothetical protein BLJAPNOD_02345 [Ensifer sp. M14]|jgi:hypothetical protein|uniref:hypothetical protein n=1 Tax=Ensifer sp. M14 TaxID=2203782 RepID=UPI000E2E2CEF|nr:hypothetical protein [Ensifer sp. M14]RDL51213.1 hypothetical protein BLJAPNOD_02345 [Ensifer sp. M14]